MSIFYANTKTYSRSAGDISMVSLPQFNIRPEQIKETLIEITDNNLQELNSHLDQVKNFTWENVIPLLETLEDRLQQFWSPIHHLHAVSTSTELRLAYQNCLPILSNYQTLLSQHEKLYHAFRQLKESSNFELLNTAQQQVIRHALRDFHLAGVDLPKPQQKRYAEIQHRLAELSTTFGEHLLDATQAWNYLVTDEKMLAGLPDHVLSSTHQAAQIKKQQEGWLLTLDYPCYSAVLKYAENRELREKIYQAYSIRASELGSSEWDNTIIIDEILQLRHELALLLGFHNYAELSLSTKMATSSEQVLTFLKSLIDYAVPKAKQELSELEKFAELKLEPWDIPFYSEKLKQQRYQISQEMLRDYFPLENVLQGLFTLMQKVFGLRIEKQTPEIEAWHPDVQFFAIYDKSDQLRGYFYLDLYVRENKREGAWMDDFCSRRQLINGKIQTPIAFLTCNFSKPQKGKPTLITHDEVTTLFHEFGHGLHHLLTMVDYLDVSGIHGVPWDAVEFPSQFMENWCWQQPVLDIISCHYLTGQPLPSQILSQLLAARHFHAGLQLLRQLEFALFDFRLHLTYQPQKNISAQTIIDQIRAEIAVIKVPAYNRFQHTFSHIFDGGYAAGYYSYLWAEVLSSDAFAIFEEQGIFNQQLGQRFLSTILEKGGSESPMDLFVAFRGREPDSKALLKHLGLITS